MVAVTRGGGTPGETTTEPDGTTVCLREESGAVDLVVRPGADRVLWLALTSSTTAGVPDYQPLRVAAEGIASLLIARLAPPRR